MIRHSVLLVVTLPVLATAGCGDTGRRAAAAGDVAVRMLQAVAVGDGRAACALLAPDTAAELAGSQETPCERAVLAQDLPAPAAVRRTQIYGQWAQVRLDSDTVFLAAFRAGWRVVAAGCTVRGGDEPYDCTVQGG